MNNEKILKDLEKKLRDKMLAIKNKRITPKESKIGLFFREIKNKDIVLYENLMGEYKQVLKKIK
jgi:hypothetical protein